MIAELTNIEASRYNRHLVLPHFGVEGQLALKKARVLVVGAGGLGSPVIQYLSAAGVGTLGVIDPDAVELSNLQRQVIYRTNAVGHSKVTEAAKLVEGLNHLVKFEGYPFALTPDNAEELIKQYDIVVDGSDNFATRYLVNDACVVMGKTFVGASVFQYSGQISVFNALFRDGTRGPTYRCLFPEPPAATAAPNCAQGGVIGALVGILGSLQALEVIKVLSAVGEPLVGRLLVYDALKNSFHSLSFTRDEAIVQRTKVLSADQYRFNCEGAMAQKVNEISVSELKKKIDSREDFVLIDVREPFERDICSLDGRSIPLAEIESHLDSIPRDKTVVIHCRSGGRSGKAVETLQGKHGYTNLFNLKGGILAWASEIDPTMKKY